jgi:hypothetical protein
VQAGTGTCRDFVVIQYLYALEALIDRLQFVLFVHHHISGLLIKGNSPANTFWCMTGIEMQ